MSFCEIESGLRRLLEEVPRNYIFRLNNCFHIPVYSGWKAQQHENPNLHILYVWSGEGQYRMEDGVTIPLRQGSLVFVSNGVKHYAEVSPDNPLTVTGMRFWVYDYNNVNRTNHFVKPFYTYNLYNDHFNSEVISRIHYLFHNKKDNISQSMCSTYISYILFSLYQKLTDKNAEKDLDKRAKEARRIIENNGFKKIDISQVANQVGTSQRNLQKLFKTAYGFTPNEYHMSIKMNMIYSMLNSDKIPVSEAAEYMGYSDQFAFSKQFKKYFGISPAKVKSEHPPVWF
ncbi:MAG: HTH-type transcriptional activator Btr [Firmicutes bacterium ADurb.Bin193]|nr:MAG: HTH-type transcriptional activator Btr [Firmicutes bacterium ADurb.Bin193]